ncbi:MAG: amino acid adenylation domain-containing protein [Herbinix sp.]|nr:amino acid adenylation domain-containing protein [Herbinix sp.]
MTRDDRLNIGKPIANTQIYILDQESKLQPIGVPGEICIGGKGLARGYLNNSELTAEKFISNPYNKDELIYKTGDLAAWLPDGTIDFIGRNDNQIKLRGFRIELGEIENVLLSYPLVKEAAVCVCYKNDDPFICAYIVGDFDVDTKNVRDYLSKSLPFYMIPACFVKLDSMLLNANGKINRKALPQPDFNQSYNDMEFIEPQTDVEKKLCDIWKETLGIEKVGISNSFFELGGHSISMMNVIAKIDKAFKVDIRFDDFIQNSTVAALASIISEGDTTYCNKVVYPEATPDLEHMHNPFPLTDVQMAYFMGRNDQFEMGGISTHVYVEIETEMEIERLNRSLNQVIARHPMMRAILLPNGQQQILERTADYKIIETDLMEFSTIEQKQYIEKNREIMSHYIFQTDIWPLFDFKSFKLNDHKNYLCIGLDLIIADAFSYQIIFHELVTFYNNPEIVLPELKFSFRDYIMSYMNFKGSDTYARDKEYWLSKLPDFPNAPAVPLKADPSKITKPHFKRHSKVIYKNEWEIIKQKGRLHGVTPSTILCTLYAQVLSFWSNQPHMAINLTVFNRYPFHADVQKIVGDFTSVILLDIDLSVGSFWECAKQVQSILVNALEHRHYDGIEFIREIAKYRNEGTKASMPFVFTSALFGNSDSLDSCLNEMGKFKMGINQTSQVYIDHQVTEVNGNLNIVFDYVDELFESNVIDTMFSQYITVLDGLMNDTIKIEIRKKDSNTIEKYDDTTGYNEPSTLNGLFKEQVKKNPDNIAVIFQEDNITYKELDKKSNQVACYLMNQGVVRGDYVGVLGHRCIDTIVTILGILKAGAAYVPVDPSYPDDRKKYILDHSNCKLMLTPDLYLDQELDSYESNEVGIYNNYQDSAYVIYTSGSTGKPKGVVISHAAAANTIIDINNKFMVNESDRIIGLSSMCFDLSVYDIFGTLVSGATLVMVVDQRDILNLAHIVEDNNITIWNSVPAIMDMMVENLESGYSYTSLRLVLLSGDWIPLKLPNKVRSSFVNAQVISLGGATEASIWSIYYPIKEVKDEWRSIPYGRPLENQKFYVLNYNKELCPIGVPGELYIGGVGVAKGYINDEGKTKASFIMHPQFGYLYKTGDYGVLHACEDEDTAFIEFLGRKDQQVKIRGYRVELGEIESRLLEHEFIKNAVVIDNVDTTGHKYLCAYYVAEDDITSEEIKIYLRRQLPDYMVPQYFVEMDEIPLTANGKINRSALPALEICANVDNDQYVAPRDELECRLVDIWREVLDIERISVKDNFFELGGNSILMVQIVTKINREFDVNISFKLFVEKNNIENVAELIRNSSAKCKNVTYPLVEPDPANMHVPFPLTEVQTAYLLGRENLFEIGDVATHAYMEMESQLDIERFNYALQMVIDYNPMMRAVIYPNGTQQILEVVPEYKINIVDLSNATSEEKDKHIIKERERMSHYVFKTDVWPLFEFKAFKLSADSYYLCMGFDMLIADGASIQLINRMLVKFYNNSNAIIPKVDFTFRDYMLAYNKFKQSEIYQEDKKYWLDKLEEFPQAPALPLRMDTADVKKPHFKRFRKEFTSERWDCLKKKAMENSITPSALLSTVYAEVLAFWSNQPHLAINLTVFNRYPFHEDVYSVVGDFTSVMLLDIDLLPNTTFWDRAKRIQDTLVASLEHRHYDGIEFIREITKYHELGTKAAMPIVFTSMLFGNKNSNSESLSGMGNVKMGAGQTSQVYIDYQANEIDGQLTVTWDYVEDIFNPEVISTMFDQYIKILDFLMDESVEYRPEVDASVKALYEKYNDTKEDIPQCTLHGMFESQVQRVPDHTAVVFEDDSITYRELSEKSNQIAHYLREQGVESGSLVGVLGQRCIETIINILGIIKASAAYVPIDPGYPEERKEYIFKNSECKFFITPDLYQEKRINEYPISELDINVSCDDMAYVIYTSGSTGRPKGVTISHGAAANTIHDINRKFSVNENDRIIGLSSMCFDLSVYDIFGSLGSGATLVMVEDQRDVVKLMDTLQEKEITVWNSVPAIMDMLIENLDMNNTNSSLRLVMLSGDWIPLRLPEKVKHSFENATLISLGGATEASIWSIYYPIMEVDENWKSIPYGIPLANQKFYVLNYEMNLCPIGVQGELYIGGVGLSKGYINEEEKTKGAFIHHPIYGDLYRTGDYGVLQHHNENQTYIEFLGRKDQQVKIRGYRVELGEIESQLMEHDFVRNAVVLDRVNSRGQKYLCAYYIPEEEVSPEELKIYLLRRLSDYMVPMQFVEVEDIPLTANGKVNRKALLECANTLNESEDNYISPRNETEARLAEIWSEVLGVEHIGIRDSFFELGGNSILMVQARILISKEYKVDISLRDFFENNTLEKLVILMSTKKGTSQDVIYPEVEPTPEHMYERFPLTAVQTAYLMGRDSQFEMGGVSTHVYMEFETTLDMERFKKSLQKVIDRHPMLRTVIFSDGSQQVLDSVPEYEIKISDISNLSDEEKNQKIIVERNRKSHHIFKTDVWPLFDISAFKLNDNTNYLFMELDMLIADGASMQIISKELMDYYQNMNVNLPAINFTYRDYILALNDFKTSPVYFSDKDYWMSKLEDFPNAPALPLKQEPSLITKPTFRRLSRVFDKNDWNVMKKVAQEKGITPSALLCTAYAQVLAYWSNQPHMAINLTVFNRYPFHKDVNKIVGDFTSVMLLDIQLTESVSFWENAVNIQKTLFDALEHRHYDGIEFIRELTRYRNYGTKAIMPIVFTSMLFDSNSDSADEEQDLGEVKMSVSQTSQVYVDYQVMERNGRLSVTWDCVDGLFEDEVINSMFSQYVSILEKLIVDTKEYCIELDEKNVQLLEKYNSSESEIELHTLHEMFTERSKKQPDQIAIEYGEDYITYQQLDKESNRVANYLRTIGIERNDYVGVLCKRRIHTLINIIGILKAGAAYVPIDPDYPEERKNYILDHSNCKCILSVDMEDIYSDSSVENINTLNDVAYVIYTSGSTGKPKGVIITHGAAANTILDINKKFNVCEKDRLIGISSMCFDLSVYDIFGALCCGATLVLINDQRDVSNIYDIIEKKKITIWNSVPAIMELMLDNIESEEEEVDLWISRKTASKQNLIKRNDNLRLVLLSGDWIPLNLPKKISNIFINAEVISLGGATEASIWSIYYPIEEVEEAWNSIPYGYPLANQNFYILNYEGKQCPVDVKGELYIGGTGLANGYLNDIEKTNSAFIESKQYGRLYKTGDYGVMREEGYIEFLGRKDHQVKLGGYRVELGEIENCLNEYKKIKASAVIDLTDDSNKKFLCAYYVSSQEIDVSDLRRQLSLKLPEYMIPQYYMRIEEIPLTPNGKRNLKVFPKPDGNHVERKEYVAPSNEMEQKFVELWKDILNIECIGVTDNLIELGASSINIMRFISGVMKEYGVELSISNLLHTPTIQQCTLQVIQSSIDARDYSSELSLLIPDGIKTKNIFCFPPIGSVGIVYRRMAEVLESYAFYSFNFIESDNRIDEYIKTIQSIQQEGPYILFGYSAGGNLAFEVAKELINHGYEVSHLILWDSYFIDEINKNRMTEEEGRDAADTMIEEFVKENVELMPNLKILKDYFRKKIIKYIEYLDYLVTSGEVDSNIHLVKAEEETEEAFEGKQMKWKDSTMKRFFFYKGYGIHSEMLKLGFIERNAEIMRSILEDDER